MHVTSINILARGNKELVEGCHYSELITATGVKYSDVKILQIKDSEKVSFESEKSVILNVPFEKIKNWVI